MSTGNIPSGDKPNRKPTVSIIGAGLAGISAAIALKDQLGYEDFIIYEKGSDIGGTWRENTYPGCGSDVSCHWYSLSTELNPNWKSRYALQPEILTYWKSLFMKYKLAKHLVTGTLVKSARWDIARQAYELTLEDVRTGETRSGVYTEILVSAIGGFLSPAYPKDLPGINDFKGHIWHSAKWNHDVPLSGKKIGVIGNGCSSAQIVPELAKDPSSQILNFCRGPQWYSPRMQFDYSETAKWIFRNVPGAQRLYRSYLMIASDLVYIIFTKNTPSKLLRISRNRLESYIRKKAPKEHHEKLIPKFSPGCRRIVADPGYLKSLHKPNVDICWEAIDAIVEDGIRLKTGVVIPLDVIVLATGFIVENTDLDMQGSDGRTLQGYFEAKNGPCAYLGTSVPGFPNFFLLLGPNTITGHASIIFSEEVQIQFALRLMKPVIEGLAKSFEVRDEATDAYNEYLHQRLATNVTMECVSYYRRNFTGKNMATFPGPQVLFYWLLRRTKWENYKVVDGEKFKARMRNGRMAIRILVATVLVGGLACFNW